MKKLLIVLLLSTAFSFSQQKQFPKKALNDTFLTLEGEELPFSKILNRYKGKTILIDVWAGWCKDCVGGLPKVKKLQDKYKDVIFVFLSLDKTPQSWKNAIQTLDIKGEHYYIQSGWKGAFCSGIELDWIPRYMIVNPEGKITLYKAITADDKNLKNLLQNTKTNN